MKTILINGSNGFIASNFINKFGYKYKFIKLSHKAHSGYYTYNEICNNKELLKKIDVVINLAGSNIAEKRWSASRKEDLISSRISSTRQLIDLFNPLSKKPHFISASAVSIYDTSVNNDEGTHVDYYRYDNFSQEITKKWETTASSYAGSLTRLRFGTVLSSLDGAFPKILKPFLFYAGTGLGTGTQHLPWIALEDLLNCINFIIENKLLDVYNLTSPQLITFNELDLEIARIWQKPYWFNIPENVVKLLFGQMGEELFMNDLIVNSRSICRAGYRFKYGDLPVCLKAIKSNKF